MKTLDEEPVIKTLGERVKGKSKLEATKTTENFIDVFRRIYNDMCNKCRLKAFSCIKRKIPFKYEMLCEECQSMAKGYEKEANEAME